jgi:hypothetical protein
MGSIRPTNRRGAAGAAHPAPPLRPRAASSCRRGHLVQIGARLRCVQRQATGGFDRRSVSSSSAGTQGSTAAQPPPSRRGIPAG